MLAKPVMLYKAFPYLVYITPQIPLVKMCHMTKSSPKSMKQESMVLLTDDTINHRTMSGDIEPSQGEGGNE